MSTVSALNLRHQNNNNFSRQRKIRKYVSEKSLNVTEIVARARVRARALWLLRYLHVQSSFHVQKDLSRFVELRVRNHSERDC